MGTSGNSARMGESTFWYISRAKGKYVECQQDYPGGPIYYLDERWERKVLAKTPTVGKWDHEDPVLEQTHGV